MIRLLSLLLAGALTLGAASMDPERLAAIPKRMQAPPGQAGNPGGEQVKAAGGKADHGPYNTGMLALIQRVASASVAVDGDTIGAIGPGLLALVGVEPGDAAAQVERSTAMPPPEAERIFAALLDKCREIHPPGVETGRFGAHMAVSLVNDGPVTFLLRA